MIGEENGTLIWRIFHSGSCTKGGYKRLHMQHCSRQVLQGYSIPASHLTLKIITACMLYWSYMCCPINYRDPTIMSYQHPPATPHIALGARMSLIMIKLQNVVKYTPCYEALKCHPCYPDSLSSQHVDGTSTLPYCNFCSWKWQIKPETSEQTRFQQCL